jgi:integrase
VVTHQFQRLLKRAGLPRPRFHDLRHSCASLLLAQGVSARMVVETLGRSDISTTMDTYSHVMPSLRQDAADAMDPGAGRDWPLRFCCTFAVNGAAGAGRPAPFPV